MYQYGNKNRVLRYLISISVGLGVLFLAGCQLLSGEQSTEFRKNRVLQDTVVAEKTVRYEILPDLSEIRFLVFRAGPMARLGHNHVVQAKNIRGEIQLASNIHQSRFFIEIPVKDFLVDAGSARLDEGAEFFPQPDDEAIAGTTKNMLGEKVLGAARYPTIEIRSVALNGPAWGMDITVRIGMHGVEREMVVPTAVESDGDRLVATSFLSINQTDFGIVPMKILGGVLQVDNMIKVRMRIVASKAAPSSR